MYGGNGGNCNGCGGGGGGGGGVGGGGGGGMNMFSSFAKAFHSVNPGNYNGYGPMAYVWPSETSNNWQFDPSAQFNQFDTTE